MKRKLGITVAAVMGLMLLGSGNARALPPGAHQISPRPGSLQKRICEGTVRGLTGNYTFGKMDGVVVGLCILPEGVGAASLPPEFVGVWLAAGATDNQCKKSDWKGIAASGSDRLINVTLRSLEEWESGCNVAYIMRPIAPAHGQWCAWKRTNTTYSLQGTDALPPHST